MGSFKEKNREGVNEMKENSKEATDLGTEMNSQAEQINSILEGIDLQDEEDTQAIEGAGHSYQESFNGAFSEQVEPAGQEVEQKGEQISSEVEGELDNVKSAMESLSEASGISDIGSDAAEGARSQLENSSSEYGDIISEAQEVAKDTQQQIESLKGDLSGIFG